MRGKRKIIHLVFIVIAGIIVMGLKSFEFMLTDAWEYYEKGSYGKSISIYEKILLEDPNEKTALLMAGWNYFKLDRFEEALMAFEQLDKIEKDSFDVQEGLGWANFKLGNYQASLKIFEIMHAKKNKHTGTIEGLAYNHFKLGNAKASKQFLEIALQNNPKSPDNNLIRGYVASMEMDWDTAIKYFKESMKLAGKEDPDTLVALGNACLGKKDYNEADYYFGQALQKNISHIDAYNGKTRLLYIKQSEMAKGAELFTKGSYDEAMEAYQEVEKKYPRWPEVYAGKGWVRYKKSDYQGAIKEFQNSVKNYELLYDSYDGLGWSYLKLDEAKKARASFQKALELYPGYYSSVSGLLELDKAVKKE